MALKARRYELLLFHVALLSSGRRLVIYELFVLTVCVLRSRVREVKARVELYVKRPERQTHIILGLSAALIVYAFIVLYLSVGLEPVMSCRWVFAGFAIFSLALALVDLVYYRSQRSKEFGEPHRVSLFLARHIFELRLLAYFVFFLTALVAILADLFDFLLPPHLQQSATELVEFYDRMFSFEPEARIAYLVAFLIFKSSKPYKHLRRLKEEALRSLNRLAEKHKTAKVFSQELKDRLIEVAQDAVLGLAFVAVLFDLSLRQKIIVSLVFLLHLRIAGEETLRIELPDVPIKLYSELEFIAIPDDKRDNTLVARLSSPMMEFSLAMALLGIFAKSLAVIFFERLGLLIVPPLVMIYRIYRALHEEPEGLSEDSRRALML